MKQPPKKQPEDSLFRDATQDVEPLQQEQAPPYRKKLPPHPLQLSEETESDDGLVEPLLEQRIEAGDLLIFARPGVQDRLLRDLRRGRIEIGLELDLHGLTVREAKKNLDPFLAECHKRGVRCAHIIHGKGYGSSEQQPVLKQQVNLWLRQRPDVLAFCTATRRDGGTGAVYVLLRNPNKRRSKRFD